MTEKPRPDAERPARMTLGAVRTFLAEEFPQIAHDGSAYSVDAVGHGVARMTLVYHDRHLRPGGTLSGPAMMSLADVTFYVALLGAIGPVALAVTTNFSINFLRKPEPRDLVADCRFMKIGRTLAIGQCDLLQGAERVAHAVATYSIPPKG